MRITRTVAFFLLSLIPCAAYAQQAQKPTSNSQTIEGTVIGTDGTKYWSGFKIESGGKEYRFVTEYSVGQGTNPKIVGGKCCEIGTKVKVSYTGSLTRYLLNVTHIVIIDPKTAGQFMPRDDGVTLVPVPAKNAATSRQPVARQITSEESFFYRLALYGRGLPPDPREKSYDNVDAYGKTFDNVNYQRAMADEFERGRYRERLQAKIADEVKKVDFGRRFTSTAYATLGEYSFESHSFPLLWTPRGLTGVNESQFSSSLPISESDANAFVKSRSASRGSVDRRIVLRVTYSIVNDKTPWNGFFFFFQSIEAFGDEKLTWKIGVIPKLNLTGPNTAEEWRLANVAAQAAAGTIRKNSIGMEMVYIPPGAFMMGADSGGERPVHPVTITQGFWMGKYEVTQSQWEQVMGTTVRQQRDKEDPKYRLYSEGADSSMQYVSWEEARDFVAKLNQRKDGFEYSLPSEAQWEYAARGSTTGADVDYIGDIRKYGEEALLTTDPYHVGTKSPNSFGLYDMHVKVSEWCEDWFESYSAGAVTDPKGPMSGTKRVLRGGTSYVPLITYPEPARSTSRHGAEPTYRWHTVGFRIAAIARIQSGETPKNTVSTSAGVSSILNNVKTSEQSEPASDKGLAPSSNKPSVKNPIGMEFVWIPPGDFMMGSINGEADEKPIHRVIISQGFWMGKYEVTLSQYETIVGSSMAHFPECRDCPVAPVSWNEAQRFVSQLNTKNDGFIYSLPTEAQWEYAARAGTTEAYADKVKLDDRAWYQRNSGFKTHPVGTRQPNAFGLFDMLGNVPEWCQDSYEGYSADMATDPVVNKEKNIYGNTIDRVFRGGSWASGADKITYANREGSQPGLRFQNSPGFRVVAQKLGERGGNMPPATKQATATGDPRSFASLSAAIDRGEDVVFNIKYDYAVAPYHYLHDGIVTVNKNAVVFDGRIGDLDFTVSPEKILEMTNHPQQAALIRLKVSVKNKKGDKESKKDLYFYNLGATTVGSGPGGTGFSIACNRCDDSMNVLYALIQKVRGISAIAFTQTLAPTLHSVQPFSD